jgi:dipeptidyl aminopeptidase/acylaminoacyl peptidase
MLGLLPEDVGILVTPSDPRLSRDGAHVALTVHRADLQANRTQGHVWVAATDGASPPRPVSPDDVSASLGRWSPDGTHLAYAARPVDDDDAVSEIRIVAARSGEERVVCSCPSEPSEIEWSPDGTRVAFVARDPDPDCYGAPGENRKERDMPPRRIERLVTRLDSVGWISDRPSRVFIVPCDGSAPPCAFTTGAYEASGAAWSPDGRRVAFASGRHESWDLDWAVDLFIADVSGEPGPLQRVTDTGPTYSLPSWAPDGAHLACLRGNSELDGPWHGQVALVGSDGAGETILTAALDRNCAPYPASRAPVWLGDALLFLVEDRGCVQLWRTDTTRPGACAPVVDGDRFLGSFDAVDDTVAFIASSPSSVPEVFVVVAGVETRVTDFTSELTAAGRRIAVAEPFSASPASDASVAVDCWIIEPEHPAGSRVPVVLNIHGGPFTQYGSRFFDEFQFEVGAGLGVLFCNPRGSSGYSEAWGRAIRWPECKLDPGSGWGGVDYDDVIACVEEALRRYDWIDADRIAVMGGSYGGYMTSWIIGQTDRFAAAVSERSVNNLLTLDHGSDIAGSFVSYVGVRHIDDPEPYLRRSPISYVRDMTTPLLIVHSEKDLRCPVNQAEELFVALRLLGRTPEFVRFPGESHELSRAGAPRHRAQRAEVILDFLRRQLIGSSVGAVGGEDLVAQ